MFFFLIKVKKVLSLRRLLEIPRGFSFRQQRVQKSNEGSIGTIPSYSVVSLTSLTEEAPCYVTEVITNIKDRRTTQC